MEDHIAEALEDDVTAGYVPRLPLESLWLAGTDMPQMTLRRDIEFMLTHPIVIVALDYFKSGILGAQFWGDKDHLDPSNIFGKPISEDARVAEFVLSQVERFWRQAVPLMQEGGYPYGWGCGEHIYKEVNGVMTWDRVKDFHPSDTFILTQDFRAVGVRVKRIRGAKSTMDLWFASGAIPAKVCWYAHRPRFNQHYGRSQLIGAWRPWRRLGWRDCVEQVIDAAIYRAGYAGPIIKHPPEDMQTARSGAPATQTDGAGNPRRSARDVARQMVEWAKAGAGFTMSSATYPATHGGGPKWSIDWPTAVMDVMPLVEAAKYMEDQIFYGIGVPPELIRASGTGSGYSGRSIPREAFMMEQQSIANSMLYMFIAQVVQPLVLLNFGDIPFSVNVKSLLKSTTEDKQQGGDAVGGRPRDEHGKFKPVDDTK